MIQTLFLIAKSRTHSILSVVPYYMHEITFKVEHVRKTLRYLVTNKCFEFDSISRIVLKICAPALVTNINSPHSNFVPQRYFFGHLESCANITCLQKESKTIASNYRPLPLLSVISKISKSIINANIIKYFNQLIDDRQYGILLERSNVDLAFVTVNKSIACWFPSFQIIYLNFQLSL